MTSIKIGSETIILQTKAKLIGVYLDNNQKWKSQIHSTINQLNSRLYLLRRLARVISKERIKKNK